MNSEISILILSIFFIFAVIATGLLLYKKKLINTEGARKFIHIGVSNWIFFWYFGLFGLFYSIIGPLFFIGANILFIFTPLRSLLGLNNVKRDMGLVYFPIALSLLVFLSYKGIVPREITLCSILAMGYGDGLAAFLGQKWGKHQYKIFGNKKSLEGSLVMLLMLIFICFLFLDLPFYKVLLLAFIPTFLEAFVGLGLDNLAVPLSFALLGTLL
jgi:phytol kinase